jgi:tetratricopeptide (TPR) repeat protein
MPQAEEALRILQCQLEQARGDATGKAERCLKDAGVEPHTAADWNNQGWSRLQQGRIDDAIADFTEASKIDPEYDKARINKANAWSAPLGLDRSGSRN